MKLLPIMRRVGGNNRYSHTLIFAIVAYAMVDDRFYGYLMQFTWILHSQGYPVRRKRGGNIYLHKEVLELAEISVLDQVDHIDRDPLNAQLSNLRLATESQNGANKKLHKDSSSGFKGVCWSKHKQKWLARIRLQGCLVHIGYFNSPILAALAYDIAALKLHGPYALTNQSLGLLLKVED